MLGLGCAWLWMTEFFQELFARNSLGGAWRVMRKTSTMNLNPQRAQALFVAALEFSDAAARREWLDRECAEDVALRQRVLDLLGAHEAAGGFGAQASASQVEATV